MLKAATPVSTTLDAFIARANEELQDVAAAPFKPEHREGLLRKELEALEAQLATASARAVAAEARAEAAERRVAAVEAQPVERRGSTRWGLTIAAFLIGGAAMFALRFVVPGKEDPVTPAATPVVTSPPASAITPVTPPTARITFEPLAEPVPAVPTPVAVPEHVVDTATKKPVAKPPRRPARREDAAATPKPPEDDLYNPF